jgi:hypothetical protein
MRTRFYLGLLFALGGGCDDVTAGQPTDSAAPPQLVHVLVQDARYLLNFPNRASSVDLLDNNPFANRACTIVCKGNCPADPGTTPPAQLDTCVTEWLVDQIAPDVSCTAAGVCSDAFKVPSTGIPVPLSGVTFGVQAADNRDPGGGIQVRLVFDKVLDTSIEVVTQDTTKAPGATFSYAVAPGIIELDDESGTAVPSKIYLDNGGSPEFSSDLELVPLGPALVIKPKASLDAATTYTVKITNPGALKDRKGQAVVGLGGSAVPTSIKFKTEDLTPAVAGVFGSGFDYPDFSAPAEITPNEVIQIGFYENAAGDTATVDFTTAPAGVKAIAFSDRGGDATACTKAEPGNILVDVVNSDTGDVATAAPVDWPAGDYTFTITVKDINGKSTFTSDPMSFTVAGTDEADPTVDPNIAAAHLTPSQCSM